MQPHLNLRGAFPSSTVQRLTLGRRRARWRRIPASVCWLRTLQLDAVLLTVVALVCASAAVVTSVVVIGSGGVRRRGVVLVVVVGCGGVLAVCVVVAWARGPACAVEGLSAGFAAATGG